MSLRCLLSYNFTIYVTAELLHFLIAMGAVYTARKLETNDETATNFHRIDYVEDIDDSHNSGISCMTRCISRT
jgi:hypothetical protein